MALCPYGQHRLALNEDGACKRCGADLRLYSAVRDLRNLAGQTPEQLVQANQVVPAEPAEPRANGLTTPKPAAELPQSSANHPRPARWLAIAVSAGLIGWSIGFVWPRRPQPSLSPPATSVALPASALPSLALRGRQSMFDAGVTSAAKLCIIEIDQHTIRVEGEVASLQEKNLIERILKSIPGVETVNFQGAIDRERYSVRAGDTLWRLAEKWYNDPTQWQRIAAANGLTDPDNLRLGHKLLIPH